MTLADNSVPLYEITVKNKRFFVESRNVKGLEVATMVLNGTPYEFLLQPASGREPAILLNPRKVKVDTDPADVSRYFVHENGAPNIPEVKDAKNNLPPQFRNYETQKLVSEAIKPLATSLSQTIDKQNSDLQTALAAININIESQRLVLEKSIQDDFVKISESQHATFKRGWDQITETTNKKVTEWFANYRERTKKELSSEIVTFSKNLIEESMAAQKEALLNESNTQLASLSASTYKWIREQIHNIGQATDQLLIEKNEQAADALDTKVVQITEQVDKQLKHLVTQVQTESAKIEKNLQSDVNKKASKFDTLSTSLEKIIKETPDRVTHLFDTASKSWSKKISEAVTEIDGFKKHISTDQTKLSTKVENLTEKVKETEKELEIQKKTISKETKGYIDKQVVEMKRLIARGAESGGGSSGPPGAGGSGNPEVNAVVIGTSANWNSVYTTVNDLSAFWNGDVTLILAHSANWDAAYTSTSTNSANWNSTYSTVGTNSANWDVAFNYGTDFSINSAYYDSVYSTVDTNSANWNSSFTVLVGNSANWNTAAGYATVFSINSANYGSVYSTVDSNSSNWNSVFTTTNSNSASWNTAYSYSTVYSTNSASYATISYVANYLPLSGGSVVGDLTIFGNLTAYGTTTFLDTQVVVTSAMHVTNLGTGPALVVNQVGPQPIVDFQDDNVTVFRIADDGLVGIMTTTPNVELTVKGAISATGDVTFNSSLNLMPTVSGAAIILGAKSFYVYSGAGDVTWTLPDLASSPNRMYFIKNRSAAGNLTLNASGADNLYYTSVTPSHNVGPGEAYIIANDGTYWEVM